MNGKLLYAVFTVTVSETDIPGVKRNPQLERLPDIYLFYIIVINRADAGPSNR